MHPGCSGKLVADADLEEALRDSSLQVTATLALRQVTEMPEVFDVMLCSQRPTQGHALDELRRYRRQRGEPIIDFCGNRRSHRPDALLTNTAVVHLEVLDAGAQIAHGIRIIPERHQLLYPVDTRLVVFEPYPRA